MNIYRIREKHVIGLEFQVWHLFCERMIETSKIIVSLKYLGDTTKYKLININSEYKPKFDERHSR